MKILIICRTKPLYKIHVHICVIDSMCFCLSVSVSLFDDCADSDLHVVSFLLEYYIYHNSFCLKGLICHFCSFPLYCRLNLIILLLLLDDESLRVTCCILMVRYQK